MDFTKSNARMELLKDKTRRIYISYKNNSIHTEFRIIGKMLYYDIGCREYKWKEDLNIRVVNNSKTNIPGYLVLRYYYDNHGNLIADHECFIAYTIDDLLEKVNLLNIDMLNKLQSLMVEEKLIKNVY